MPSAIPGDALRRRFADAGQGHVFAFERDLDEAGRARLHARLAEIDLDLVAQFQQLIRSVPSAVTTATTFEPPDVVPRRRGDVETTVERRARQRGADILRAGSVGWLVVAGGQASRLGYDAPKGCFPVTPLGATSLYELFARKIHAARTRHGVGAPWYVMTSDATDGPTRATFEKSGHFGLDPGDVFFFRQSMVPALDVAGRILMAEKDAPFLSPNGHGGVLAALASTGGLEHARERGVTTFSYFQIDNPLARPADAVFLGHHALSGARMSSKVVKKRSADEKVGVLGRVDGRLSCIEYSDLPGHLRDARDERGQLVFSAGNIAVHAIERTFVEDLTRGGLRLPWHRAKKRIACLGPDGARIEVDGSKFEAFVFDALGEAGASVVLEVAREEEFSPVKNKEGEDSPASARRDQCRLHAGWAARAGVALPPPRADGLHVVEVDPRFAEDADEFAARMPARPREIDGGHLYAP